MIFKYSPLIMKWLSALVVLCSLISSVLITINPPSDELRNLNPLTVKTVMLVLLIVLGAILPLLIMNTGSSRSRLLTKAAVFATASLANAVTLSPLITVPFQEIPSLIAIIAGFAMTIVCLFAFQETMERKNPMSKF